MLAFVKIVYIYNLKSGVDLKEFEDYYFNKMIDQVMKKVPKVEKFCFSIASGDELSPYRYMAECFSKN